MRLKRQQSWALTALLVSTFAGVPNRCLFAQTLVFSGSTSTAAVQNDMAMNPANSPKVSVVEFSSAGINLVPFGAAEFDASLELSVPTAVATAIQSLLPYSVFIRNDSNKPVIAYTVSWALVDRTGAPDTYYHTVCDDIALRALISPHSATLVTTLAPLTASIVDSGQVLQDISDEAARLQNQASVTIGLEAVMFEDGTTIGKDRSLSITMIRGRLQSEYDLYRSVAARANAPDLLMSWLQEIADQVKPGGKLSFGVDPFPEWYRLYRARSANQLLKFIAAKSVPEMVLYVQSSLQDKRYPPLVVRP